MHLSGFFVHGHSDTGIVEGEEKQGRNYDKENCLPYCMFEEGTPGRLALSNQVRWDCIVLGVYLWRG